MKFLHTSDWHLGMSFQNTSLIDDQRVFIEQLHNIIKENNVDAVIIAGDVYDSSVSSSSAIELYNMAITKICFEENITTFVIAGNHDGAARLASLNKLLARTNMYVTGKLVRDITPVTIDDTAFWSIPYFNTDEVKALYPEKAEEISSYGMAAMTVCDDIRSKMDKTKKNVVIAHMFVAGSELSDSDRSTRVGTSNMVPKSVFEGFEYVALGHIHRPQQVTEHIRYCGSPLVYSFGSEEKYEKSVTIVDTEKMSRVTIPIVPLHKMRTIEGKFEEIMNMPDSDDYVNVLFKDIYVGADIIARVREHFPNAMEIRGKISELSINGESSISSDDINSMSDEEIIISFLKEKYLYEPNEAQVALIKKAIEISEEEVDLS